MHYTRQPPSLVPNSLREKVKKKEPSGRACRQRGVPSERPVERRLRVHGSLCRRPMRACRAPQHAHVTHDMSDMT